jgi:hypothetical protein
MSLRIEFDGTWDIQIQRQIAATLRACVGDVPEGEPWNVSVTSYRNFCTVHIKTPKQTRKKLFFLPPSKLADAIPPWLTQYPLR